MDFGSPDGSSFSKPLGLPPVVVVNVAFVFCRGFVRGNSLKTLCVLFQLGLEARGCHTYATPQPTCG